MTILTTLTNCDTPNIAAIPAQATPANSTTRVRDPITGTERTSANTAAHSSHFLANF